MVDPKVSVIVPVYNAGHRLRACLDSLVCQTLKELELIFVLDCPTDESDKIVFEYSQKNPNIIVITNKKNLNIGLSRNEGIKVAKGEYVAFCDHDDIVKEYMYEHMYNLGKQKDADIILGVPEYSYEDTSKNVTYYYPQEGDVKDILLPLIVGRDDAMVGWEFFFSHGVIWDNLYRLDFLKKHNILFVDNNIITFEDNLFLIETLIHANKAIVYNELVYIHTIEDTNTAASSGFVKTDKVINYIHYLNDLLVKNGLKDDFYNNYIKSVCSYLRGCIWRELKNDTYRLVYRLEHTKDVIVSLKNDMVIASAFRSIGLMEFLSDSITFRSKLFDIIIYTYLKH